MTGSELIAIKTYIDANLAKLASLVAISSTSERNEAHVKFSEASRIMNDMITQRMNAPASNVANAAISNSEIESLLKDEEDR